MDFLFLIFQLAILVMSVVIHEVSHGAMAFYLGDDTAKRFGRLSLNPLRHLDLWGSFLMPLFLFIATSGRAMFGWAKPVPYNPYNLRDQRWGPALVAGAGPAANLAVALVFGSGLRFLAGAEWFSFALVQIFSLIVLLNILLAIFNLVPFPPLDGSKILFAVLPSRLENVRIALERFGSIFLIVFILFFFSWLWPLVFWLFELFTGSSLFV